MLPMRWVTRMNVLSTTLLTWFWMVQHLRTPLHAIYNNPRLDRKEATIMLLDNGATADAKDMVSQKNDEGYKILMENSEWRNCAPHCRAVWRYRFHGSAVEFRKCFGRPSGYSKSNSPPQGRLHRTNWSYSAPIRTSRWCTRAGQKWKKRTPLFLLSQTKGDCQTPPWPPRELIILR